MKKVFLVCMSLIVLLIGCSKDVVNEVPGRKLYEFSDDYEYNTSVKGYKTRRIPISNDVNAPFSDEVMHGFYKDNKLIVNLDFNNVIEVYKNMFDQRIRVYFDEKNQVWEINYNAENEKYIKFNFNNNQIRINDLSILDNVINFSGYDYYNELEVIKEQKELVINLSDYDLELVHSGDAYLVPAHLLNFLLSSYNYKMLFDGDRFIYQEIAFSNDIQIPRKSYEVTSDLYTYAHNIDSLIFDNFYGLKGYNLTYMDTFDQLDSYSSYPTDYQSYFDNLNDRHTNILGSTYGANDNEVVQISNLVNDKNEYQRLGCYNTNVYNEKILSNSTYYLEVNTFDKQGMQNELSRKILNASRKYENVIIDVRCNGGGYLSSASNTVLNIDSDAKIYSGNPYDAVYVEESTSKKSKNPANIYLVTSNMTYSAANAFVSYMNDNLDVTIIGEKSGGGAAVLGVYASASGLVMSMSSAQNIILDKDYNVIEAGIEVDVEYTFNNGSGQLDQYYNDLLNIIGG